MLNRVSGGDRFPRVALVVAPLLAYAAVAYACVPDYNPHAEPDAGAHDGGDGSVPHPDADAGTRDGGDATMLGSDAADGDSEAAVDAPPDAPTEGGGDSGDAGLPTLLDLARAPVAIGTDSYGNYACAIHAGAVYCWGDANNTYGEMGFPAPADGGMNYPRPVLATTLADAGLPVQMGLGSVHTCYLRQDRQVYCHGSNEASQFGNGTGVDGPQEFKVIGLTDGADLVGVGGAFSCALTHTPSAGSPGNVYCWGNNQLGQLARTDNRPGSQAWAVVVMTDAGADGIHDATWVSANGSHACVVTAGKKVLCWGTTTWLESGPDAATACDTYGNNCSAIPQTINLPAGETPVQVALGTRHSCALASSGHVYCWGGNDDDQLGQPGAQPACPLPEAGVAINTDGGGACSAAPLLVPGLPRIIWITSGEAHTCALDVNRHAWCWGGPENRSLGRGDCPNSGPCPALGAMNVVDINSLQPFVFDALVAGGRKSCGISHGVLYCWGQEELGTVEPDGGEPDDSFPQPVNF